MPEFRRQVPTSAEFRKPTDLKKKRPDHLRLVTPPDKKAGSAPTSDFLRLEESAVLDNRNQVVESLSEYAPETPKIISEEEQLDAELKDLITWPEHPNLETAQKILSEITFAESSLYNLKKYEGDPSYNEGNRPDESKMLAEISRLEDQIASLNAALNLVIVPALKEVPAIKRYAEAARERFLNFAPETKGGKNILNPNADKDLRQRFAVHFNKKTGGDQQFGMKIHEFFELEIDEMMSDIKALEDWRDSHTVQIPQSKPLAPVRAITEPQLRTISNQESQSSAQKPGLFKRTTNRIVNAFSSIFKKVA